DSRAEGLAGFQPLHEEALAFRFDLTEASAIQALLAMTPHLHKASYAGRQAAAQLQRIALTADVRLRWYRRC
ncbi:MAG TPA: rRNA (guanine-N1)-methyltransferase, partial [Motiliproteus sp.]